MLDDSPTGHEDVLLGASGLRLNREVYPAITENPSALLSKLTDSALRLEEKKVLCVGNREGCIGSFGAVCDLAANGSNEDLGMSAHHKIRRNRGNQLTLENSPKSSDGTRSDFVSLHTLS